MVTGGGGHELHPGHELAELLWCDPVGVCFGVIVVDIHDHAIRGDEGCAGAAVIHIGGCHMIKPGDRRQRSRVRDGVLVRVVVVILYAGNGRGVQGEGRGHGVTS
ncbi:Uncharacterised protein [Chlamydia trachomatis]|nr:Uncharacterised protein [Chlamydia trachomatis]